MEAPMKTTFFTHAAMSALLLATSVAVAAAQTTGPIESPGPGGTLNQQLELTPAQKSAILKAVGSEKSKNASVQFPTVVGAEVPPSINLYALPDEAVNNNSAAKLYQFTVVQGDVVIVDPTKMRVVEVIRKLSE
jgi:hypothetical protein